MSGDIADDQDDMTIAYMLGFERGKDAAAATITAQAQEIERMKVALSAERERCAVVAERFSEAALQCDRCGDVRTTYVPGGCSGETAFRASDEYARMVALDGAYTAMAYFEKHLCNPREIDRDKLPGAIAAAIRKETT